MAGDSRSSASSRARTRSAHTQRALATFNLVSSTQPPINLTSLFPSCRARHLPHSPSDHPPSTHTPTHTLLHTEGADSNETTTSPLLLLLGVSRAQHMRDDTLYLPRIPGQRRRRPTDATTASGPSPRRDLSTVRPTDRAFFGARVCRGRPCKHGDFRLASRGDSRAHL